YLSSTSPYNGADLFALRYRRNHRDSWYVANAHRLGCQEYKEALPSGACLVYIRDRARMQSLGLHYLKFNLVGALGIIVQLLALHLLTSFFGLNYLIATGLAVEAAILHNFALHERWTWSDRPRQNRIESVYRLFRFNSTTGVISIIGNLIFM